MCSPMEALNFVRTEFQAFGKTREFKHNIVAVSCLIKREGGSGCEISEKSVKEVERSNESAARVAKHSNSRCPLQPGTTSDATTHPSDSASSGTSHHETSRTKCNSDEEAQVQKTESVSIIIT